MWEEAKSLEDDAELTSRCVGVPIIGTNRAASERNVARVNWLKEVGAAE